MALSTTDFIDVLHENVRRMDLVLLSTVPVLLLLVHALPEPVRRGLAFRFRAPTLVTAYTSHFVHLSLEHLLVNLVGYILLAGVCYVLAVLADRRQLFGMAITTYLLAFPLVLSALNLAIPRDAIGYGFSGVNMALLGLLPLLLAEYTEQNLNPAVGVRHAPSLFFSGLVLVSLVALPLTLLSVGLAIAAGFVVLLYASSLRTSHRESPTAASESVLTGSSSGWADQFFIGLIVFLGYLFIGFPLSATVDGAVLNTYAHLLGFCLAFIVHYLVLELGLLDATETADVQR
ncbi:hypothetical protein HUG10_07285 [Halorarum halophilum]|uniref:Rhomboid family protein n=1 Tax=Halorarum halophilum TaxID=2743090 RepID=A0A7D5GE01_9EURY|nr:hypothetical protein HUG10_07285 [Halobaculum halophilum]